MGEVEKILIIRFSSLGDILLATPLIRVVRDAFPSARIDFLTKAEYRDVLKFNPHLSSVLELENSDFGSLREIGSRLRKEHYDLLLDIHNSLRSRYLRYRTRAAKTRVVNKRSVRRFFLVNLKWNLYRRIVSVADRYLETVGYLNLQHDGKGLEISLQEEIVGATTSILSKFHLDRCKYVIGLVPTARHFTKRWPIEKFVELGVELAQRHHVRFLIFGGREDREYCSDLAQMINARSGASAAENLAGTLSLLETAAAFDFCDVIVSNDSGLMHLAAARKRKIIAIFGSTVREFGFLPYGTPHTVVEVPGLKCRPCTPIGRSRCPKGHFRCMRDIHVRDVVRVTEEMLTTHISQQ